MHRARGENKGRSNEAAGVHFLKTLWNIDTNHDEVKSVIGEKPDTDIYHTVSSKRPIPPRNRA